MTSVDFSCDKHEKLGLLGYIFVNPPADGHVVPLFRRGWDNGTRHLDALDSTCEKGHVDAAGRVGAQRAVAGSRPSGSAASKVSRASATDS